MQQEIISNSNSTTQYQDIRHLEINLNHWYVVARSAEVGTKPLGVIEDSKRIDVVDIQKRHIATFHW